MKKKINVLPKSMRESKRYFKLDCTMLELKKLKDCFIYLFGALKFAESGFAIKDDKEKIIKINREFENEFVFCVAYCNKTENLKIKIIKESGTIKSLE
jgi:RNase P/RNase MRP subunit POP5